MRFAASILVLFCAASSLRAAEIVTEEPVRLQVLRTLFPGAKISAGYPVKVVEAPARRDDFEPWESEFGGDPLDREMAYRVIGPVTGHEEGAASDVLDSQRSSDQRRVQFRLYRLRARADGSAALVAIVFYNFPEANPPRCCRTVGRVLLLSASGDRVLAEVDRMPYGFHGFPMFQFLEGASNGDERLLVGASLSGAATIGMEAVVFAVSAEKLTVLGWRTTTLSYYGGATEEDNTVFTSRLDEGRTRQAKGNRVWFIKKTYVKKGKTLSTPITSSFSIRLHLKGVPLNWE